MGYVTISVDVDLDEFDDDDLLKEIKGRGYKIEVQEKCEPALIKTLEDKMKYEYLMRVFHKHSLTEIEKMIQL
jgi:hypothetical protein